MVNAQIQLNGAAERWYVRGFVKNLTKNNAVTGQYVGDQSSGLYTNIFTLEPRQYGVGRGVQVLTEATSRRVSRWADPKERR